MIPPRRVRKLNSRAISLSGWTRSGLPFPSKHRKEPINMKNNIILLFTYGTLQRGNVRHHLLDGAEYCGPAATVGRYVLKDRGDFPFLVKLSKKGIKKVGDEAVRVH